MRPFIIQAMGSSCVFGLTIPSRARENQRLDADWRFLQDDPASLSGQAMSPADLNWIESSWQPVSLSHCWGWNDALAGKNFFHGPGWHRRELLVGARTNAVTNHA